MFIYATCVLVSLFVSKVSADNCCGKSDCPDSCPWNDSCRDGNDFDCMDEVAGAMKCRDTTACTTFEDCDESAAAYRSGQLCRSFPWFNGGYPFDPVKLDNEVKQTSCESSATDLFCNKWTTRGDSVDELEVGQGECTVASANGEYCKKWREVTKEYKKCWWSQYITDDGGSTMGEVCCSEDNKHLYPCCTQACDPSTYDTRPPEIETATCQCVQAAEEDLYCHKWTCEETSELSFLVDYDATEYETYTCVSSRPTDATNRGATSLGWDELSEAWGGLDHLKDGPVAADELGGGRYCSHWSGDIESVEEFELARCGCLEESAGGNFCLRWACLEKGTDFWWPNLNWLAFSVVMVALGQVLGASIFSCNEITTSTHVKVLSYVLICVIWGGSFTVIGVWKCGLICVFVYLFQCFLLPLLVWGVYSALSGQCCAATDTAASVKKQTLEPSAPAAAVVTEVKDREPQPYFLVSAELTGQTEDCSNEL
jgi:hypothetical protein